jgi:spermidine synthase
MNSRRFLPALLLLFVGSGCAALIYEIVWFQLLQLVIGSSSISLGVLLGTFMGGMCLGSLALPRVISPHYHPLRVYAMLELGIGVIGVVVLFGMPLVGGAYTSVAGHGMPAILLRALVCAVCLLPPTLLMGATLPAVARWVETSREGVAWLGFFYGGNIVGAVSGCLLAGFYLLRVHDVATATYVAVTINFAVAAIGHGLASVTAYEPASAAEPAAGDARAPGAVTVYVAVALSGLSALGAEVVWTRLLSLILGATVYTFSIILAVFLVGLGIGSTGGAALSRDVRSPRAALGWCQMLLAGAIAWTAYMLAGSVPFWPVNPSIAIDPWFNLQIDLMRCLWAVLPATILWGASFPLALAAAAAPGQDPGRLVGGVYAANTLGAILGAVGFSMLVVPLVGTQQAERLLIGLAAVAGLLMLAPTLEQPAWRLARLIAIAGAAALAAFLVNGVLPTPAGLIGYGRYVATHVGEQITYRYIGEGMNASVAVSELPGGVRNFHVSGKVEASTEPQDMRLQRMLGHIPALVHPNPRSVLVVGFGAGVTAGSFVTYPGIERIVICEIEPLIPQVIGRHFARENHEVLADPRVKVVYDDARHYILTSREKFDLITSDPIHPWVKGAATLYTREYFELVRAHLNPGGVVTQWVPLYESDAGVVKSEVATFFEVFPDGTVWGNLNNGEGYDIVLLGREEAAPIDVTAMHQRLERLDYVAVKTALEQVGITSPLDLFGTFAGQASDLRPWLAGAVINRDRNLRLQYLAGLGLNQYESDAIYREMLSYRRFPENLFMAPPEWQQALMNALARPR